MRVLAVFANPPSPIRRRSYELLRALQADGVDVTIATIVANAQEASDCDVLESSGFEVLRGRVGRFRQVRQLSVAWVKREPLQYRYAWSPRFASRLRQVVQQAMRQGEPYDLVHVEHLRAAAYGEALSDLAPVVWDAVDCISYLFEQAAVLSTTWRARAVTRLEMAPTKRCEARLLTRFSRVLVCSGVDRDRFIDLLSSAHETVAGRCVPVVVPNAVDTRHFRPLESGEREPDTILFSGKLSYHANVTAAFVLVNDIMPIVWRHRPDVRLVLAGAQPTAAIRGLGDQHPGRVVVTGPVADLRDYLQVCTVSVAPLRYAAGSQYKVIEALACGAPVVVSSVALRGLDADVGQDLQAGEDDASVAGHILHLLSHPDEAAALGARGRRYAIANHDARRVGGLLSSIHRDVARGAVSSQLPGWDDPEAAATLARGSSA